MMIGTFGSAASFRHRDSRGAAIPGGKTERFLRNVLFMDNLENSSAGMAGKNKMLNIVQEYRFNNRTQRTI
jgi:hypothetical protein